MTSRAPLHLENARSADTDRHGTRAVTPGGERTAAVCEAMIELADVVFRDSKAPRAVDDRFALHRSLRPRGAGVLGYQRQGADGDDAPAFDCTSRTP